MYHVVKVGRGERSVASIAYSIRSRHHAIIEPMKDQRFFAHSLKMELYRKEQDKWIYYAFGANDEIDLACLGVHFPVAEVYDCIDPKEDFFSGAENETFPGQ